MNRRVLGIVVAVLLGLAGTIALFAYVQSARDDAAESEPTTTILVVEQPIAQGLTLSEIQSRVVATEVPERLVVDGALAELDSLPDELVAGVELQPGEQLLRSRLVAPSELVRVEVPVGLQEITVALNPERAVGGALRSGDLVGLVFSFEPFETSAADQGDPVDPAETAPETTVAGPTKTPNTTNLTLQKILVTSVQLSRQDAERASEVRDVSEDDPEQPAIDPNIAEAPGDQLLVTLAVNGPEVEQIVFAAEFGRIWMTLQNAETDEANTRIVTLGQVYIPVPR
jgi:pilus assembly protein CpaB